MNSKYYKKDYLEFDEYGMTAVNCMRCNTHIRERVVAPHTMPDGKVVHVYRMKTYSHFRQVPYMLSDGSYTNILMCADCADSHKEDEEEKDGMVKQLKRGWIQSMEQAKSPKERIDRINKLDLKVKDKYKGGKLWDTHHQRHTR